MTLIELKEYLSSEGFKLKIDGQSLNEYIKERATYDTEDLDERIYDEPVELTLTNKEKTSYSVVSMQEAFECCGKLYIFGFSTFDKRNCELLLKSAEVLGETLGYSYLGFVHTADHQSVEVGKELGYKELIKFRNRRSGNDLSEMCKII